jgi:hypothetical protein
MAAALWVARLGLAGMLAGDQASRIAALALLVAGGLVVYGGLAVLFGAAVPADLKSMLRRDRPAAGA